MPLPDGARAWHPSQIFVEVVGCYREARLCSQWVQRFCLPLPPKGQLPLKQLDRTIPPIAALMRPSVQKIGADIDRDTNDACEMKGKSLPKPGFGLGFAQQRSWRTSGGKRVSERQQGQMENLAEKHGRKCAPFRAAAA